MLFPFMFCFGGASHYTSPKSLVTTGVSWLDPLDFAAYGEENISRIVCTWTPECQSPLSDGGMIRMTPTKRVRLCDPQLYNYYYKHKHKGMMFVARPLNNKWGFEHVGKCIFEKVDLSCFEHWILGLTTIRVLILSEKMEVHLMLFCC